MQDCSQILKINTAIALAGITWNMLPVLVYDDTPENTAAYPRIILQDCIIGPQIGNRISWRQNVTQIIKVTDRYKDDVDTASVNFVANSICAILVPSTIPPYMDLNPTHRIILAQVDSISNQRYGDPFTTYRFVDRNIRISYLIEEIAATGVAAL